MGVYFGIDPGANGALCLLNTSTKDIIFKPTYAIDFQPFTARQWIIQMHTQHHINMIGIEDVHAIFGTSAGSNFKFGYNVGLLRGIIESTGLGLDLVQPKAWQKKIGIKSSKKLKGKALKNAIADTALRLYPNALLFGSRGGLMDGRADALMIAHYMSLKYEGSTL